MADLPQTLHIRLDLHGGVLHLWLNRPERRNALSSQMVEEISATFAAIAGDRSIRIVILRGAGETFCAGGDIANMSVAQASPPPGAPDELRDNNRRFGAVLEAINAAPQVVIAVVEGYAMGGGFGLTCVADITITTADARFALSEATIGVVAAAVSSFATARRSIPPFAKPAIKFSNAHLRPLLSPSGYCCAPLVRARSPNCSMKRPRALPLRFAVPRAGKARRRSWKSESRLG
jgi:enoyl-CoA hydratase/carnithine racemase